MGQVRPSKVRDGSEGCTGGTSGGGLASLLTKLSGPQEANGTECVQGGSDDDCLEYEVHPNGRHQG